MKLSMSEKESTALFNTFTQAVKDAAELRAKADQLQKQLTETSNKLRMTEGELFRKKEDYSDLRDMLTSTQATNTRLSTEVIQLKHEVERERKGLPMQIRSIRFVGKREFGESGPQPDDIYDSYSLVEFLAAKIPQRNAA